MLQPELQHSLLDTREQYQKAVCQSLIGFLAQRRIADHFATDAGLPYVQEAIQAILEKKSQPKTSTKSVQDKEASPLACLRYGGSIGVILEKLGLCNDALHRQRLGLPHLVELVDRVGV